MSLFFAIRIPQEMWNPLTLVQERLPKLPGLRMSVTQDFHVTFKFLGECDALQTLEATVNARSAIKNMKFVPEDLEISYSKLNYFHKHGRPNVLWAGLKVSPQLYQFQYDLEEMMMELGFERAKEKFRPHVTLARIREFRDDSKIPEWKEAFSKLGVQRKSFSVSSLELIESSFEVGHAPEYKTVETFPFI